MRASFDETAPSGVIGTENEIGSKSRKQVVFPAVTIFKN
jgi:hypothetical protein